MTERGELIIKMKNSKRTHTHTHFDKFPQANQATQLPIHNYREL